MFTLESVLKRITLAVSGSERAKCFWHFIVLLATIEFMEKNISTN